MDLTKCTNIPFQISLTGTRFVAASEAGAPPAHQKAVLRAGPHDTIRSTIYTGRPMRLIKNSYVVDAEENHAEDIKAFADRGIIYMQGKWCLQAYEIVLQMRPLT